MTRWTTAALWLVSVLTLAAQTASRRTDIPLGPPPGATVVRDLVYAHAGPREMKLDLYRPEKPNGVVPLVVWIHGGAFLSGSKESREGEAAVWLAARGYAVASIDYRLSQEALFPAQKEDCEAAVRWLRANAARFGLEGSRIGVFGASAGGHLAAMLGTAGSAAGLVQAVVDFYGPTDFNKMDAAALPGGMKHNPADSPESRLIGGLIQENPDKVARANPITYVTPAAPPFLILHGDRDPLVPVNQSELLYDALTKDRVPVTFHKIVGAGHGGPAFNTPMVRAMVLAFLDEHVRRAK